MKKFTLLFAITFLPFTSHADADELDSQINKACLRHAISLVARLKSDVVELNSKKSDQALKLATDSCQAYFKKEFSQNPVAVVEKDPEKERDWFTEKMLSGDSAKKDGNKRLQRK